MRGREEREGGGMVPLAQSLGTMTTTVTKCKSIPNTSPPLVMRKEFARGVW